MDRKGVAPRCRVHTAARLRGLQGLKRAALRRCGAGVRVFVVLAALVAGLTYGGVLDLAWVHDNFLVRAPTPLRAVAAA